VHWSGEGLPVAQISSLLTHPDSKQEPMLGVYYYRINVSKTDSPTNGVRVRHALGLAIDRNSLVEHSVNDLHTDAGPVVPPMPGFVLGATGEYLERRANEVVAGAGHPGGDGLPNVALLYHCDDTHGHVAEPIQAMWKQILGIDV